MIDEALRLRPEQHELTPEQALAADRFAEARIREHLSTEPVDEPAAEAQLAEAYTLAGMPPPEEVYWLDGPLQFVAALTPPGVLDRVKARLDQRLLDRIVPLAQGSGWDASAWWGPDSPCVWMQVRQGRGSAIMSALDAQGLRPLKLEVIKRIHSRIHSVIAWHIQPEIANCVDAAAYATTEDTDSVDVITTVASSLNGAVRDSVMAYEDAPGRAVLAFFNTYYAPNPLHALDRFSQLVSGYWLGKTCALVVRRPRLLLRDAADKLHSEESRCLEYSDGWGFWAWHGVVVPRKVILRPEALTRSNFFRTRNVEVRRVIQERMGGRFLAELGAQPIDNGARGTLYEVKMPGDPDRVARYVQVRDASTDREYFLRVPPTITMADEAVAWTFGLSAQTYHPDQET